MEIKQTKEEKILEKTTLRRIYEVENGKMNRDKKMKEWNKKACCEREK